MEREKERERGGTKVDRPQSTSFWHSGRKANTGQALSYSPAYREILPTLRKIPLILPKEVGLYLINGSLQLQKGQIKC